MVVRIASSTDRTHGVSPVIAVILMVAITVVLSGVVFVWASTISGNAGSCLDYSMFEIRVKDDPSGDHITISVTRGTENWDQTRIIVKPDDGSTIFADTSGIPNKSTAGDEIILSTFVDDSGTPVSFDVSKGDPIHIKIVNMNNNAVQAQTNLIAA